MTAPKAQAFSGGRGRLLLLCVLLCVFLSGVVQANPASQASGLSCRSEWPAWEYFKTSFIGSEGRVIDPADARLITTSEGQSYALFFALLNNEQPLFDKLLRWTVDKLAQGDFSRHLPAWLWGQQESGQWGVLDANSAADSDLWIAYNLLEAGRLWGVREYTLLGHWLLGQIAAQEIVALPGFGSLLLPGPDGFADAGQWRLNPSYLPPPIVQGIAVHQSRPPWPELAANTTRFLLQTAPLGVAPDWVVWDGKRWRYPDTAAQWASYNAIRVYLWVGLLDDAAVDAQRLKAHFRQGLAFIGRHDWPAEQLDVLSGKAQGQGPVGFSAALLPLFAADDFGERQRKRIADTALDSLGYYGSALLLFGQGWDEGRYRFDEDGFVIPEWVDCQ